MAKRRQIRPSRIRLLDALHEGRVPQPGVPSGPRNSASVEPPSHSGGTSGDLSIPHFHNETPIDNTPYDPGEAPTSVQRSIRREHSRPTATRTTPAASTLISAVSDLLTPGGAPSPRDIAHAAHTLGVKPISDAVDRAASLPEKAGSELGQAAALVAHLPEQKVTQAFGHKTLGTPTMGEVLRAAQKGMPATKQSRNPATALVSSRARSGKRGLALNDRGELTVPRTRRASADLATAKQRYRQAARAGDLPYLEGEPERNAKTVLRIGRKVGASPKELLSAIETGIVESGFANLHGGDADSEGWRQERTSIYGTGPQGPTDVGAAARRYFQEAKTDPTIAGGGGETAGQLAQTVQGSAFPERYGEHQLEAQGILHAFNQGKPDPQAAAALKVAKKNARAVGINPTPANGDVAGGGKDYTVVRADAKGMVDWLESMIGEVEGSPKIERLANNLGLNSVTQPWCANLVSNGLLRRGFSLSELPTNLNNTPQFEEWGAAGKYATNLGTDLAKAKPGDVLTFSGAHTATYIGNGEMISGNFSDQVERTPVSAGPAPLSMIIRPHYKGGKVKIPDSQLPGSTTMAATASPGEAVVGGSVAGSEAGGAGTRAGNQVVAPAPFGQVPISSLLATTSLAPEQNLPGEEAEPDGEATGAIARIISRKRL